MKLTKYLAFKTQQHFIYFNLETVLHGMI